jgi:DNA mismatch repair protein MutS
MALKAKYRDAILLFRIGEFYEAFGDDAKVLSKMTDVMLKEGSEDAEIKHSASLPHYSLDIALRKLVKSGYKVGICEALEEPRKANIGSKRSTKNSLK